MSNINTNGINSSYPVPGVNNSTQGFRDNFASIKTNLNTAYEELSDLQDKVIVKSALNSTALNNDMANTLISNASVRGFRSPTYNLGSSIPASIVVDVSKGDIQYGTITQNTAITFGAWAPTGTKSNVQLYLTIANTDAYIQFPETFYDAGNIALTGTKPGIFKVQNYEGSYTVGAGVNQKTVTLNYDPSVSLASKTIYNKVGVPAGVTELQFNISSIDCGSTIDIEPMNVGQMNQIRIGTPTAHGTAGDSEGSMYVDGSFAYICTNPYGNVNLQIISGTGNGTACVLYFEPQAIPPFKEGDTITVTGTDVPEFNGTQEVAACNVDAVAFLNTTVADVGAVIATVSGQRAIWGKVALTAV